MDLLGRLSYLGEEFIFAQTSFVKSSRQYILISPSNLNDPSAKDRSYNYYLDGGELEQDYILGILDPVRKLSYGSLPILNIIYQELAKVVREARLNKDIRNYDTTDRTNKALFVEEYKSGESVIQMVGNLHFDIKLYNERLSLEASQVHRTKFRPRKLGKLLTEIKKDNLAKYTNGSFLDASFESLQKDGFDMSWMENKSYIPVHSLEDWDNLVIPSLIKEYKRWEREKDFEFFLISIDFESDGLDAFDSKHPTQSRSVYFSISFKDNESFGVFLDMENFQNVDIKGIAERLTYLTQINPLSDRDLVFESNGEKLEIKRSSLTVIAHNMMIDRRFGFLIGADIWFDLCTMQLSFNLDPFMTKGKNGLKYIVRKFFDIDYAELGEICGKRNYHMFRELSDKRVIMMYGCADTDLHRLAAKRLIEIVNKSEEYYGVNHVKEHMRLDSLYNNFKAKSDYDGMRVKYSEFEKEYKEKTRILNLYYNFLSEYVGRVKAYNDYEEKVISAERYNIELEGLSPRDIDKARPYLVDKWSGKALETAIFKVLNYPILAWTQQNKKSKLEGRKFVPKPALNVEALEHYLKYDSPVSLERISESMENQESLEDLKLYSMYLRSDFIDTTTGNVLISKEEFNSHRFPFMLVLLKISPILKKVQSELGPVVESNSEYKFASCNTHSAVTRRDLNPIQTTSRDGKYNYIAYSDDYYFGSVDQNAVEIRILYGLSRDKTLINALLDPEKDSHTETTSLMRQKPAYQVTKKERKETKELAFGIPYGKQVYSACLSLFKEINSENLAITAQLFDLYSEKLAPVMEVLNKTRDQMDIVVNPPKELSDYLEFNPEKKYGRMINEFGFCQHLEIRDNDEGFRQALRRKAGNFIIQGWAANFIRILLVQIMKEVMKKGWYYNNLFMLHLTVHDEIDFSYHKSLNPVEVVEMLHKSMTVSVEGFPTFFVGINIGNNWGEAKADESELPVRLVNQLCKRLARGDFKDYDFGDHTEFFRRERENYFKNRIIVELKNMNDNSNVWNIVKLNEKFQNYTVRAMLSDFIGKPLFKVKDKDDPVESLASTLPKFVSKYMLSSDSRKHHIVIDTKHTVITPTMHENTYESLDALLDAVPENTKIQVTNNEDDLSDLLFDLDEDSDIEDEFASFDFNMAESEESFPIDGIEDISTDFLESYVKLVSKDDFVEYGSVKDRVAVLAKETSTNVPTFKNFKVRNNSVILTVYDVKVLTDIRKIIRGKKTHSLVSYKLYLKVSGKLNDYGSVTEETLRLIDRRLEEVK